MTRVNRIGFEAGIPACMKSSGNSTLSLSTARYRDSGKCSLKWDYTAGSSIRVSRPIGFTPFSDGKDQGSQGRDTFAVWVYNETPRDDQLTFQFGKDGRVDCSFPFSLRFNGWRTAWVAFERDMDGSPQSDMDELTIRAPQNSGSGTVYFGQIVLSSPVDPRYHTRDFQVPFVNMEADHKANNHWLALYRFYHLRSEYGLQSNAEDQALYTEAVHEISRRVEQSILEAKDVTEERMAQIRQQIQQYGITRHEGAISGVPVNFVHCNDLFPKPVRQQMEEQYKWENVKLYTQFMLLVANCYRSTDNPVFRGELKAFFLDMADHLHDQGWACGSGLGTLHHLGYSLQSYYSSLFLMRDVLEEHGAIKRSAEDLYWFSGAGRIFAEGVSGGIIDIFHTTLRGMLAAILLLDDASEKIAHLKQLSVWVSRFLLPAPGLMSCFKKDGSAFHHGGHYPAYAIGGFTGVTPVIYFLRSTPFRISEKAHSSLKHALMTMRLYCNKHEWLLSLAARHPTGAGKLAVEPYGYMALAGTPDGLEEIDREAAAAYLRLMPEQSEHPWKKKLMEHGVTAEADPNGHWTMNYASLAIHRRDRWLVGARGHSKYLWANETYTAANLYGRYITYGHVQIMSQGEPVNNRDSGYVHDGWDWNRWPGTTAVRLPLEQLRADVRNLDTFSGFEEMLLSDESFAGGLHIEGKNGMFAMKLSGHPKYNDRLRAKKSVFFFDNRVICLGSDIGSDNTSYPTETTLFQNHLADPGMESIGVIEEGRIAAFPYTGQLDGTSASWIQDNKGNGYYVPKGQCVGIQCSTQQSKSQDKGEDTFGDFAAAWISHGTNPTGGAYEYAIWVQATLEETKQYAERMKRSESALYKVLQQDKQAHIVQDTPTGTIGYALFEAGELGMLPSECVIGDVSIPCMAMTKLTGGALTVSIVDPDLRLYSGIDADQYGEDGTRQEVSIYSRPWISSESQASTVRVTLKGRWRIEEERSAFCRIVIQNNEITVMEFECKDALPLEVSLVKQQL